MTQEFRARDYLLDELMKAVLYDVQRLTPVVRKWIDWNLFVLFFGQVMAQFLYQIAVADLEDRFTSNSGWFDQFVSDVIRMQGKSIVIFVENRGPHCLWRYAVFITEFSRGYARHYDYRIRQSHKRI